MTSRSINQPANQNIKNQNRSSINVLAKQRSGITNNQSSKISTKVINQASIR